MKNYKRLWSFIKKRSYLLVISLVMILIIQVLSFITPLLVAHVLDDCIMGLEKPWVEVKIESENCVVFKNRIFKQKEDLKNTDEVIKEASIIFYKTGIYFIDDVVPEGNYRIEDGLLYVTTKESTTTYSFIQLNKDEIFAFYKPFIPTMFTYIILLFVKSIVVILCTFIQYFATSKMVNWIARDERTKGMECIERIPVKDFETEPAGKLASRITHDIDGMIILYRQIINLFSTALLSFIFAYIGMFYLDYRLALASFIIYPFIYLWIHYYLKHLKKIAVKVNESRSMLTAKLNEIINGIHILQIFNFRKQTIKEFDEINEEFKTENLKQVKLSSTFGNNMINVVRSAITAIIVAYFGLQYLNVAGVVITAGLIYAYNEYLTKIINPVGIIFTQIDAFEHSHVQIDRIYKVYDAQLEDDYKMPIKRYKGDISFENVWFSYVENNYVLKGISFEVHSGELVGLVGHTGSGKSSLMSLLLRFYDLDKNLPGKISIDGVDISTYSKRTYRQGIGIVLQEPVMIRGTIASNIRFGKEDVTDEEIIEILNRMGVESLYRKYEFGINQEIGLSGGNLSSGEKQIIALARAIVFNPSILVMDEATSHIDLETEKMIQSSFHELCKNRTVIVIAHRLSTIFNADKIIVLNHGEKVEEGTHEQLIKENGEYRRIYEAQIANIDIDE